MDADADDDSHAAASALLLLPFVRHGRGHTILTKHQKATMAPSRESADDAVSQNFAFKKIGTERFLYQVKSTCGAMQHCLCKNSNRVPKVHRCICCGFACHYSCSLKIQPYRDDFPGTEVCLDCVNSYGFPTIKQRTTMRVSSDNEKLVADVHGGLYLVPLELLSVDEFNEKVFQHDEDSTILEEEASKYTPSEEGEDSDEESSDDDEEGKSDDEEEEGNEEEEADKEAEEQDLGDEEQEQQQDEEDEEEEEEEEDEEEDEDDAGAPPADDEEEEQIDGEEQVPAQAPRSIHALLNSNQRLKVERLATSLHSKHSNDFFCRPGWPKLDGFYVHINEVKANKSGTETKNVAAKKRDVTQISVLATSKSSLQRFQAAFCPKQEEFDYFETTSVDAFCKRLKK